MKEMTIGIILLMSSLCFANERPRNLDGCFATSKKELEFFSEPPHGVFDMFVGNKKPQLLVTGEQVKILETRTYATFNGYNAWLYVVSADLTGWGWVNGKSLSNLEESNFTDINCD